MTKAFDNLHKALSAQSEEIENLRKENADILSDLDTAIQHNIELQQENAELRAERDKKSKLAELNFNCGLRQGQSDAKHTFERAAKAKDEYLSENEKLTNMLLEVEAERDALRARIESGIRCSVPHREQRANATLILDEGVSLDE